MDIAKRAAEIAERHLAPAADDTDAQGRWPEDNLRALGRAGLLGLHVPARLGGLGAGMSVLSEVTEILGRSCSSTAMCFGMHCVATAVLAAKATPDQEEHLLRPIARGEHITTLSLSEPGTGAHFYLPRATFTPVSGGYRLDGSKSFVTNGGHADSYVMTAVRPGAELDPGSFTCLVVTGQSAGLDWGEPWHGLGMRGNSSRSVELRNVQIPASGLLGREGDQVWYVFEVITPYFLVAMAGVYVGIAQAALDLAVASVQGRSYAHTAAPLTDNPVIVGQLGMLWARVERSRALLRRAAARGDGHLPQASQSLFAAKLDAAETAVSVTVDAMALAGGRGYQANGPLARLVRDALAGPVMTPTTHLLKQWLGRTVLGLPPL